MGLSTSVQTEDRVLWMGLLDVSASQKEFPLHLNREIWGNGERFGTMMVNPDRIFWYASRVANPNDVFLRPFKTEILKRFSSWPFHSARIVELTPELSVRRWRNFRRYGLGASIVQGRIALIGDAARDRLSLIQYGPWNCVEDAFCLAHMIGRYGHIRDNVALTEYQTYRWPLVHRATTACQRLDDFIHSTDMRSTKLREFCFSYPAMLRILGISPNLQLQGMLDDSSAMESNGVVA
uniref:FAD-binding domain-containing protein n=1 Tax=Compsopogon caeruleus TaxID=31354 RepID=A0A7S1TER0_9RHOD|mmetsp:Transcript_3915/g.7547  ORF Transcript_3915/g.7547 Transcript_3915/m.7547 type:complete len:237 (+) Transcript_3915:77-787(+)